MSGSIIEQLTLDAVTEREPEKVSGQLVFKGTRVPVSTLFENLRDGASIDEFLEWFPEVKREQVLAVLDHEIDSFLYRQAIAGAPNAAHSSFEGP